MKEKCMIFGASKTGKMAKKLLDDKYDIIGFLDNSREKWNTSFCEEKVMNPDILKNNPDIIVIIASVYYGQIYLQLKKMGMKNIKIFYYMGDTSIGTSNKYVLYTLTTEELFSECCYNKDFIKKMKSNFSINYNTIYDMSNNEKKGSTPQNKVLFCAYIFPPLGGGGVQRSLKFVKYLRKFNYEPVVLTVGESDEKINLDTTMLDELDDTIEIIRINEKTFLPPALSNREQQEIYNLYAGITENEAWLSDYLNILRTENATLIPDTKIIWVNQCLKEIESKVDLSSFQLIFTTGMPFSCYILGYYIKQKYGIKWIQDYRDAWASNDYYNKYCRENTKNLEILQQQIEQKLMQYSDFVTVTAGNLINDFVEKYHIPPEKCLEITNGYDETDFIDIDSICKNQDIFTLCHNGNLYGYFSIQHLSLLKIINRLIEEGLIQKEKIQWIFNGVVNANLKKEFDANDTYHIIKYNGYLSHIESLRIARQANLLILFGPPDEGTHYRYMGKTFEYLRLKRPILSFSRPGGVLDKLFDTAGCGVNYDFDDLDNIRKYVLECYLNWENGTEIFQCSEEEIRKYSRKNLTQKLAGVFNNLLNQ